jgi:ribosomal protein L40E
MVYCQSCGQQNPDNAQTCTRCGAELYPSRSKATSGRRDKEADECFGLPNGGAIVGLIFGSLIVIYGVSWYLGYDLSLFWSSTAGPFLVIVIGLLILAGAIYGLSRRRR